jgi:hypothetical protein
VAGFDQLQHLGALGRHAPFTVEGSQDGPTRLAKITGFCCLLGNGLMALDRLLELVSLTTKSIGCKGLLIQQCGRHPEGWEWRTCILQQA